MAHYTDLTPCTYFDGPAKRLLAVGWLEGGRPYRRAPVARRTVQALEALVRHAWQPFLYRGLHECSLCQGRTPRRGFRNLFVPADGLIYAAPELVLHYVVDHGYRPPAPFLEAVLACPPMNSPAYIAGIRDVARQIGGYSTSGWTYLADNNAALERWVLFEATPIERRRALHTVLARAIEAVGDQDVDTIPPRLPGEGVDPKWKAVAPRSAPLHPLIERGLAVLERGRPPSRALQREVAKLVERLLGTPNPPPGQSIASFTVVWELSLALTDDPAEACKAFWALESHASLDGFVAPRTAPSRRRPPKSRRKGS